MVVRQSTNEVPAILVNRRGEPIAPPKALPQSVRFDQVQAPAGAGAGGAGGALRSAGKRAQRSASKSPYQRPKPLPGISHDLGHDPAAMPPPTTGLSGLLGDMALGGPISSRTRMRAKAFQSQARTLPSLPASMAGSSSGVHPAASTVLPLAGRRGPPSKLATAREPRRLVPIHITAPPGRASLLGGLAAPPREARAAPRRGQSNVTLVQPKLVQPQPGALRSMRAR